MQNTSTINIDQVTLGEVKNQFAIRNLSAGWKILGIALLLGVAADILFYKQSFGLNALLFAALVLGGMLLAFISERNVKFVRRNVWLALPIMFCATMVFLRDEPFLTFLNLAATLLLLGLMFFTLGSNPIERLTVMAYPLSVLFSGLLASFSAMPLIGFILSHIGQRKGNVSALSRIALGLFIALPFLIVFAVLFSAADAVFAQGMKNIFNFEFLKNWPDLTAQLVWIGFVAWVCAGALLMSLARARPSAGPLNLEKPIAPLIHLGFIESATVLVSVNLLFAIFVAIQFTYLFGGSANIKIDGFTYAEYARRGFFELVAVAVVTMGMLLALDWIAKRDNGRQTITFKILNLVLIALVLVILVSAFQRMSLYESVYGFTSLRVYTHWFIIWMGVVFILKAAALWLERGQIFAFGGFLSLVISLAGFNLFNPDAFIAEQNIQRYLATGKLNAEGGGRTGLDTSYLTDMSADAVPVIMAHFDELKGDERERIGGVMRWQMDSLYQQLAKASWPSYHLARKQALDALLARRELLMQFKPRLPRYGFD